MRAYLGSEKSCPEIAPFGICNSFKTLLIDESSDGQTIQEKMLKLMTKGMNSDRVDAIKKACTQYSMFVDNAGDLRRIEDTESALAVVTSSGDDARLVFCPDANKPPAIVESNKNEKVESVAASSSSSSPRSPSLPTTKKIMRAYLGSEKSCPEIAPFGICNSFKTLLIDESSDGQTIQEKMLKLMTKGMNSDRVDAIKKACTQYSMFVDNAGDLRRIEDTESALAVVTSSGDDARLVFCPDADKPLTKPVPPPITPIPAPSSDVGSSVDVTSSCDVGSSVDVTSSCANEADKGIDDWMTEDVVNYFQSLGFPESVCTAFEENQLLGFDVRFLSEEELVEDLDINDATLRKHVMEAIDLASNPDDAKTQAIIQSNANRKIHGSTPSVAEKKIKLNPKRASTKLAFMKALNIG